jgi:hypothetical protein
MGYVGKDGDIMLVLIERLVSFNHGSARGRLVTEFPTEMLSKIVKMRSGFIRLGAFQASSCYRKRSIPFLPKRAGLGSGCQHPPNKEKVQQGYHV